MSRAMRVLLCALATVFFAVGTNDSQAAPPPETVGIDHVILGVSNLDHGTSQFEQLTGVRPAPGGAHPGRGTRNALISLGPRTYLEILAPSPGDTLSDDVSFLPSLDELTPVAWAVSTSDIGRTGQRLRDSGYETSGPKTGSRIRADGTRLKWDTLHILKPNMNMAPFFIQWGKGSLHPATSSPGGCTLWRCPIFR